MDILLETTDWDYPNHFYLLNTKNQLIAFDNGKGIKVFSKPIAFDKRYRTFKKVRHAGLQKVIDGDAKTNSNPKWQVDSDSGKTYFVELIGDEYHCNCTGYQYRGKCKHSEIVRKENS